LLYKGVLARASLAQEEIGLSQAQRINHFREIREIIERDLERRRRQKAINTASVVLAITTAGLASISVFSSWTFRVIAPATKTPSTSEIEQLSARLQKLETSFREASKEGKSPSDRTSDTSAEIPLLKGKVEALSSAILASPERALAIPLLRRDIDTLSKRIEEAKGQGKADIDRLYEQQKWMLAGIGTVLLAVAGGAVTVIFRSLPIANKEDA
jgi:predicted RNase H-like nuclease (RuvC/YqgF family)